MRSRYTNGKEMKMPERNLIRFFRSINIILQRKLKNDNRLNNKYIYETIYLINYKHT